MPPYFATEKESVLVISMTTRGVVARAAVKCGYAVTTVRDVPESVDCLRKRKYRAVLVDLDASDLDPLELVLNVRDFDAAVPIVVMASLWDAANITSLGTQPRTMLVAKSDNVADLSRDLARLPLLEAATGQAAP